MYKYLIISFCSILLINCKQQDHPEEVNFSEIEYGLMPPVIISDTSKITYTIQERMKFYDVPGVSLAVFENGDIVWEKSYGTISANSNKFVNSDTKFQAASISKAVTSLVS